MECDLDLDFATMKICVFLVYTCAFVSTKNTFASLKGTIHAPLDLISLEDISPEERKQIAYLEYKLNRSKRSGSGSGDILGVLTKAIGQGIKKKIGQIAKASVSASGHFSSSSSSSGHSSDHSYSYHHPEHVPETYDHKSFDFWSLKKSILNTLLQAVKAIKGGVIAVKGQLIKGSGKLISVKGRLISQQGESITKLGKNIAASAVLVPFHGHPSSGHGEYHHSAPSAPEEIYHEPPSALGHDYHVPENYPPPHHPDAEGLLILKKIHGQHYAEPHGVPPFKPLEPTGPGLGTIVGKLFSASSSLDPNEPKPFGDTASGGTHYEHNGLTSEEHVFTEHKPPVPPTTSYGTPFEESPGYLNQNFGDYSVSDSKHRPSYVKPNDNKLASKPNSIFGVETKPSDSEFVQPFVSGLESNKDTIQYAPIPDSSPLTNIRPTYQNLLPNSNFQVVGDAGVYNPDLLVNTNANPTVLNLPDLADYPNGFPPSPTSSQAVNSQLVSSGTGGTNSPLYSQQSPISDSWGQMSKPSPYLQTPFESNLSGIRDQGGPARFNSLEGFDGVAKHKKRSSSHNRPIVAKGVGSFGSYRPDSQSYEVVKSMSFELGPNGPKRLT